jgi:hypothetical protein
MTPPGVILKALSLTAPATYTLPLPSTAIRSARERVPCTVARAVDDLSSRPTRRDLEDILAARARDVDIVARIDRDADWAVERVASAIAASIDDLGDDTAGRDLEALSLSAPVT